MCKLSGFTPGPVDPDVVMDIYCPQGMHVGQDRWFINLSIHLCQEFEKETEVKDVQKETVVCGFCVV